MSHRLISTGAAAHRAGCSRSTIRRWIDEGLLAAHQVAPRHHFRIDPAELDTLLARLAGAE